MDLTKLPQVLEDIVLDYVAQIEHRENFQKTLNTIKTLNISHYAMGSIRNVNEKTYIIHYAITDDNEYIGSYTKTRYGNTTLTSPKILIKNIVRYVPFNGDYFQFFDIED